jgi:hypothetical protein
VTRELYLFGIQAILVVNNIIFVYQQQASNPMWLNEANLKKTDCCM